ncbi:MAG TPA: alginate export family protein [Luteimonas sp.]|nr:alginate export family protein [Luteimonas sp.]
MRTPQRSLLMLAFAITLAGPACAADRWQPEWNLRARNELVDDAGFDRDANATTLRLRAGLHGRFGDHWEALLEGEGVASAGAFNDGSNGRVDYPAVIDSEGIELNQAWVRWQATRASATLGRQRLQLDNQRWIGNSGWRQNEQTFDALAAQWQLQPSLVARYAWLDRVHRVNGDDALDPLARERSLDTHLLNVAWKQGAQQLTGYAYLHEDRDVAAASTATLGLRWTGARLRNGDGWGWTLEFARQQDYASNPLSFSHAYWLLEPSLSMGGVTWRAGWEHLGGDGGHALQTPLATLHAFNGWADKFGVTPAGGLEDRYLGAGGKFGRGRYADKLNWAVVWHDYRAEHGDHYGTEWDASLGFPIRGAVSGLVKVADYRSDGYARDTRKLWLQLEWAH